MRIKLQLIGVLILLVAIGTLDFSCSEPIKQTYTDTLSYQTKTLQRVYQNCNLDSANCTHITYSYPDFNDNSTTAKELNKIIADVFGVTKNLTLEQTQFTFMSEYEAYVKEFKNEAATWYSQTNISVPFQTNNVTCISVEMDDYTGGAHGMFSTIHTNFFKPKHEVLTLKKIFNDSSLSELLTIAEADFRTANELTSEDDFDEVGFWFKDNQFHLNDNFILTAEGITWLYNPYEIGPYSQGTIELNVSKNELLPLLNEQYKLMWE